MHPDICPRCGIAYSKFLARREAQHPAEGNFTAEPDIEIEVSPSLRQQLLAALFAVPEKTSKESFYAHALLLCAFSVWGFYFISSGVNWEIIGSSFMHNINLPFHEFGHILFMPFGEFMMILGGSLFQVLLPFVLTLVFVFKQKDTFAGSITLWWCGQSFIDVSPYIADAEYRALPLVGGSGEESHDWGNLLTMMNALEYTRAIANASFVVGTLIIMVAILWGGWILKLQKKNLVSMYDQT
ncbi:hypothetical protein [Cellvibrio mixtus]|uniref:hypothetical protein n=1 Tax=Cellvibrio mixtus TaxID=39650 RepID=UPI001F213D79|nr:hypothetical protein [Cellvibrio mixtus]